MTNVETRNVTDAGRYEAHTDGVLAGFAEYRLTDELITFTHTEVDPEFEGGGLGSALARFALDDVRADGRRKVVPRSVWHGSSGGLRIVRSCCWIARSGSPATIRARWPRARRNIRDRRAGVSDIHDPRRLNPVRVFGPVLETEKGRPRCGERPS